MGGGGCLPDYNSLQYYIGVSQNYYNNGRGDSNHKVIVQGTVTMFMYWDFTCFTATTHNI